MGLDMYLYKCPRCDDLTPSEMCEIAQIHEDRIRVANGGTEYHAGCPSVPQETIDRLIAGATVSYREWDSNHRWPCSSLMQEVGYWRKANAIHRYFVDAVQDGEDDCRCHNEVTPEILEDLRDRCKRIIESTAVINDNIVRGMHYDFSSESWQELMEESEAAPDENVCNRELPTQCGFFFGGTGYDDWYLNHVAYTYELCDELLKETDFESEMLFYCSSW